MRQYLEILTPPSVPPVTAADVKRNLGITDDYHDIDIDRLIGAAANTLIKRTGRALQLTTYRLNSDSFPCNGEWLRLPYPPLSSVTSVTYYDRDGQQQSWIEDTDYQLINSGTSTELAPAAGITRWPTVQYQRVDAVQVTYIAGYNGTDETPEEAQQFIHVWARSQYDNPDGHLTSEVAGGLNRLANSLWVGNYADPDRSPY